MKTFSLILISCLIQTAAFAEEKTYPSEAASAVSNYLARVHAEIAGKIRAEIKSEASVQNIQALLNFLDAESNSVAHSQLMEKLDSAAKQLEAARAQAAASLNDPGNKQLNLEPDGWLHEIALQKSQQSILLANIGDLQRVIGELVRWDEALDPVMPSSQINSKLRIRLSELLNQWEHQPSPSNSNSQVASITGSENKMNMEAEPSMAVVQPDVDSQPPALAPPSNFTSGEIISPINEVSPAAADVLKLKRAQVPETVILTFINNSHRPFSLNHEQIVNLHANGISMPLIRAMMYRDWMLQSESENHPNYNF